MEGGKRKRWGSGERREKRGSGERRRERGSGERRQRGKRQRISCDGGSKKWQPQLSLDCGKVRTEWRRRRRGRRRRRK